MSNKQYPRFVAYFHFVGWNELSLGIHIDVTSPNIEIHVPFGFFKIGIQWQYKVGYSKPTFGLDYKLPQRQP